DEAARQAVELAELGVLAQRLRVELIAGDLEADAGRQRLKELALRALHLDGAGLDVHLHALRDRNDLLANSRHDWLPDVAEYFAPAAGLHGLASGHHAARRRQDAGAEAREHVGDVVAAEIHAAAGPAHALDAGDHALAARAVLQHDAERALRLSAPGLPDLEALHVAFPLQDLRDLDLEARERHIDAWMPRRGGVADPGEHVCDRVSHISVSSCLLPVAGDQLACHQLDFVTPAISPSSASWRKHRRHSANLRRYARGRPQRRQRLRRRILYFGDFVSLAIFAVVAISFFLLRGFAPQTPLHAHSRGPRAPLRSRGSLAMLARIVVSGLCVLPSTFYLLPTASGTACRGAGAASAIPRRSLPW